MGKKCKKKVVWKQLSLEENNYQTLPNQDGCAYADAVSGNSQNKHQRNWQNRYLENGDKSFSNEGEHTPYNNRRQNYRPNRSNKNNGYKWRRRYDQPAEGSEKDQFNEDGEQLVQDEEYTKIETPRQEVIFKKRSLKRRKESDIENTHKDEAVADVRYDNKVVEVMQNTVHYDDSEMYIQDTSNPTLAGVVVQQLYPGGPMVSIPVHYGQYVNPTLIPGDPALLTLDPSYSRIISADEMEDVANMLPIHLDANGQPITVQVKVDEEGVPIEIEPRGFQVFEGNIEDQQYYIESQQQIIHMDECAFENMDKTNQLSEVCDTFSNDNSDAAEETEVCHEQKACDIPEQCEATDASDEHSDETETNKEEEKELKETEESSTDSQYATMSESSSPNTPASELSDPSDIPDQSVQAKLLDDTNCPVDKIVDDTHRQSSYEKSKKTQKLKPDLEVKVNNNEIVSEPKPKSSENSNLQLKVDNEFPGMTRKQRKKEAKLMKKQIKAGISPDTPVVLIKEKSNPYLFSFNSPNNNKSSVNKSLKNSLAFLNSPEFSVQEFLKNQGTVKNRCKTPLMNRTNPNLITSPLEGFGHIDLSCSQMTTNSNNMTPYMSNKVYSDTPLLKLSKVKAPLIEEVSVLEETSWANDSILESKDICLNQSETSCDSEPEYTNTTVQTINCNGTNIEETDISEVADEKFVKKISKIKIPLIETVDKSLGEMTIQNSATEHVTDVVPRISEISSETYHDSINTETQSYETNSDNMHTDNKVESNKPCNYAACSLNQHSEEVSNSTINDTPIKEVGNSTIIDPTINEVNNSTINDPTIKEIDNTTINDPNIKEIDNSTINESTIKEVEDGTGSNSASNPVNIVSSELSPPYLNPEVEPYEQMSNELQSDFHEAIMELQSNESANPDETFSKQGYVMVPVLTPYYSPRVFYGYPLVLPDNGEEPGKFNRKKKRRYRKKYNENQPQQFYDNSLVVNPFIATDDGFAIPVDPSQACHIHNCQYIPTPFPQTGIVDEGFVSAEHTPYIPNYVSEHSETLTTETELFGNLQNHEREEIVEVLKETTKPDSPESGDSGVSESEEYNKKPEIENIQETEEKSIKQPIAAKVKPKKEKANRKQNSKTYKSKKPVMIIEEPDFSSNSYPFNNKSNVPDLNKVFIKGERSKSKDKKNKKGKNKKTSSQPELAKETNHKTNNTEISSINGKKVSEIVNNSNINENSTLPVDSINHNENVDILIDKKIVKETISNNHVGINKIKKYKDDLHNEYCNDEETSFILNNGESSIIQNDQPNIKESEIILNNSFNQVVEDQVVDNSKSILNNTLNGIINEDDYIEDDSLISSYNSEENSLHELTNGVEVSSNLDLENKNDFNEIEGHLSNCLISHQSNGNSCTAEETANNSVIELDEIVDTIMNDIEILDSIPVFDASSEELSNIKENNKSSELPYTIGDTEYCNRINETLNSIGSISKDEIISLDSHDANECQVDSDSFSIDHKIVSSDLSTKSLSSNVSKQEITYNGVLEMNNEETSETHLVLNTVPDTEYYNQNGATNTDCKVTNVDAHLLHNDNFPPIINSLSSLECENIESNDPVAIKICHSLGVAKAVEKWMQEITPAKAFISNESQNIVLFEDLMECEEDKNEEQEETIEQSKNVESNPSIASLNNVNGSERVACPREENGDLSLRSSDRYFCNESVSDLDKCDPVRYTKYYQLGIDTPLSSNFSSRDTSSNRSSENLSQKLSTDEVDFQDNLYHSKKTADEMSVPRSEKVTRLYSQQSCSGMAACNLQDRKGSCSKETDCSSLFSSGLGSSLASTPLTSPCHISLVPNRIGKESFPQTIQTDPQCAIL